MNMSLKSLLTIALLLAGSMAFAYGEYDDCDGRDCRPGWGGHHGHHGPGHHGPGYEPGCPPGGYPGYPPPPPPPPPYYPPGPGPGYPPPPPPPYYPPAPQYPQYIQMECGSGDYRYSECYVGGRIVSVVMRAQYSGAACIANQTWGAYQDRIWVNSGCRGLFQVQVAR